MSTVNSYYDIGLMNEHIYQESLQYLVGGATSPSRIRPDLGGRPFYISRGEGAYLYDMDGRMYIDINAGHGASIVGHSNPAICKAAIDALAQGILCGQETPASMRAAKQVCKLVPGAELVRFLFTGTEATNVAVRLARGYTGRNNVIKFEGHFHGHNDALQFNISPPVSEAGPRENPTVRGESKGVLKENSDHITILPWNDLSVFEDCLNQKGETIAAVIMEPVNCNSGTILPQKGYLEGVRSLTKKHGIVLIFDEILSGFRTGPNCAQGYFGVIPDLTALGKALGGGFPISAIAGKREVMEALAPIGSVMNQGTYYSQNLVMHTTEAFLKLAEDKGFWDTLDKLAQKLYAGLNDLFARYHMGTISSFGNRFSMLFGIEEPPREYRDVVKVDRDLENDFFRAAYSRGLFFVRSWHHGFSIAHTFEDIDTILEAYEDIFKQIKK